MSAIGPGSIGGLNLAGSFAGAQKTESAAGRSKAEAAEQKFRLDQKGMSAHSLDDVAEAELSSDRDADGRMPFSEPFGDDDGESSEEDQGLTGPPPNRVPDASGERGNTLDLEA